MIFKELILSVFEDRKKQQIFAKNVHQIAHNFLAVIYFSIIIIIIIIRIFIHTRSTQILITTVYTQLDNTDAKIIK